MYTVSLLKEKLKNVASDDAKIVIRIKDDWSEVNSLYISLDGTVVCLNGNTVAQEEEKNKV